MKTPWSPPVFDVFPSYKGGNTLLWGKYIFEFAPGHRLQNQWGFVAQHRLVAEDKIGRQLRKGEVVHHCDENPTNNTPDNLEVMNKIDHQTHHCRKNAEAMKAKLTDLMVVDALKGRSIKNAALFLHVHPMTLRLRFPALIAPRKRRSPTKIDDPKAIAFVLRAAPDLNVQLRDVVRETGMSAATVLRICKRNGVRWVKKTRKGERHRSYRGKPTRER